VRAPVVPAPRRRGRDGLAGTAGLIRLILRRDRIVIGVWCVATIGILVGAVSAIESTYPTPQARQDRFDQVLAVPMFMLFQSRAFDTSVGALAAQQAFGGTTMAAALGAVLLVVRHTRGEEQAGRRELLGSTVIGRHAPLTAILAVVLAGGVVIAATGAVGLIGVGLPVAGSLTLATVAGGAAWIAAGLAAVAAQLTERSTVAGVAAFGVFYGLHFVRGLAHIGGDGLAWLAWLTPNGWLEQVRPFAGTRWWPLLPAAALTIGLFGVAAVLNQRRDVGAALLATRPGPAHAAPGLRGPLRLAWRLHRHSVLTAAAGLLAIGLAMGSIGATAMTGYADADWVADWAAAMRLADPADALFVYVIFVFVFASAVHAVLTLLRLHTEETSGIAESLLSTPHSRTRWAGGHLCVALTAPLLLQLSLGIGLGIGATAATGDAGELVRALGLAVPLIPAIWVIVGLTLVAFGLSGRAAPVVGWLALSVGIVAEIAVKAGLPDVVYRALSPFAHVSPYYQPTPLTYLMLTLLAAALVAAGLATLRRRDLTRS
jgi:ABC-2 type transport system permease protein